MANSARAIDVGSVIADTWAIEALIGQGGMGSVFLASHTRLPGKRVAIKLLHAEFAEGEEILKRFRREAEIASKLGHPNIVAVHDFNVTSDGTPYLVLEYLQGESLAHRMHTRRLSLDEVITIIRQVGAALSAAHREGIVHRDLKPQNIFLTATLSNGENVEVAKVLDFGISKIRGSQTVKTQESMLLGTPQYMAPEQAKGEQSAIDERTDVFALGSIVYEMLSGEPAFSGASIPEVVFKVVYESPVPLAKRVPDVPPSAIAAVETAMAKKPEDRFATVSAFVEALTGRPVSIMRVPSRPPPDVAGTPTSNIRSGGAASPSASRRAEAYDRTMGPGDVSPKPVTQRPPVNAAASTVMSDAAIGVPGDTRRPSALIAILALVAVAGIAIGLYIVLQPSDDPKVVVADAGATVASAPDAAAVVPPPLDASVAIAGDAAVVVDAAVAAKNPPAPPRDRPPPTEGDPSINENLRNAERAFGAKNYELAEQLSDGVLMSPASSAGQKARARSVRGALMCAKYNKDDKARDIARSLSGGLRQRVVAACRAVNLPID